MDQKIPEILDVYENVKATRVEVSPSLSYTNNFLVTLADPKGNNFNTRFIADPQRGQSAIDHIYTAMVASVYSGRTLTVTTTGAKTSDGYGVISSCIFSAAYTGS
ncbi:hypothetical protein [Burkholderia alba]|uniref:hypothetical protein n=1 Tax=Burkholderia alba TaxID=2683677 RepID=UPI002B056B78|nr:hypothetical protein [Burkholderia alba]